MDDAAVGAILLVLAVIGVYLLPTFVAMGRRHPAAAGVLIFNLFLGWTFLGWVLALVWAVSARPAPAPAIAPSVPVYPAPPRSGSATWIVVPLVLIVAAFFWIMHLGKEPPTVANGGIPLSPAQVLSPLGALDPDWVRISRDDEPYHIYFDEKKTEKNKDTSKIWILEDYPSPVHDGGLSFIAEYEFDCTRSALRVLKYTAYSGHMGHGVATPQTDGLGEWENSRYSDHPLRRVACEGINPAPVNSDDFPGEAAESPVPIVKSFYAALSAGDGGAAAKFVLPERRARFPFEPSGMTSYYSSLSERIRLISTELIAPDQVKVAYHYGGPDGKACDDTAVVRLRLDWGQWRIDQITASKGC